MESKDLTVSRLVLGYLKSEKCRTAAKEFFRSSRYLQQYNLNSLTKSKYIPTRFLGLTLVDILTEYFEISQIIQGRLEATNYYTECQFKSSSLSEQLLYLLNKGGPSRISSPHSTICPRSPGELNESSPSCIDPNSDVEATPIHNLPGNMHCEETYSNKTPRRSKDNLDSFNAGSSEKDQSADIVVNSEVLAQTLLENKEFHEKIAQTINKVAEKQSRELDETIKTVVRETEEDPIFDRILDEIIGSANVIDGNDQSGNNNSLNKSTDHPDGKSKTPLNRTDPKEIQTDKSTSESDNVVVNQQNEEAIQNIMITNAKISTETQTQSEEVIFFDGPLDKYLFSNTGAVSSQIVQPAQNPLYINTGSNVLMVPSTLPKTITRTIPNQQIYFLNKQPTVNYYLPTTTLPTVVSEHDILSMPTVIVSDDRTQVVKTPVVRQRTSQKATAIQPKAQIKLSSNVDIRQYLSSYSDESPKPGLKNVIYPKSAGSSVVTTGPEPSTSQPVDTSKKIGDVLTTPVVDLTDPKPSTSQPVETPKEISNVLTTPVVDLTNPKLSTSQPVDTPKEISDVITTPVVNLAQPAENSDKSKDKIERKVAEKEEIKTLPTISKSEHKTPSKEPSKKSTPKSGSHVRNLDFSTPPKITSTHKKTLKGKQVEQRKSPRKKQAVKSLFNKEEKPSTFQTKKGNSDKPASNESDKPWDANLRTLIPADELKKQTPKRKKSISGFKARKKAKIESKQADLNTTDKEAALLEAALKTPIKNEKIEKDYCKLTTEETEKQESCSAIETLGSATIPVNVGNGSDTENKNTENTAETKQDIFKEAHKSKTILSPSKMNANKRTLVNNEGEQSKFITPEMKNEGHVCQTIRVSRNITPLLKTPLKDVPKTPGIYMGTPLDMNISSLSNATPFTKMLEANLDLKGIDIASIPTPNIPITPNFAPFTPTADLISPTPYSNRGTDYSTSSSYYQPSDNEQNKSIETHILEMERSSKVIAESDGMQVEQQVKSVTASEHLHIFNKNIIGKKNLNLIRKKTDSESSDSSTSETSTEDTEDESNNSFHCKESNKTVIFKKKAPETPRRYPLRPRSVASYKNSGLLHSEGKESETHETSTSRKTRKNSEDTTLSKEKQEIKKSGKKLNEKPNLKKQAPSKSEKKSVEKPGIKINSNRKSTEKQETKNTNRNSTEKQGTKKAGRRSTEKQEIKKVCKKLTEEQDTKKAGRKSTEEQEETKKTENKGAKKINPKNKNTRSPEDMMPKVEKSDDITKQLTEIPDIEVDEEKFDSTELRAEPEVVILEKNIENTNTGMVKQKTNYLNKNLQKRKSKSPKKEKFCKYKILSELEEKRKRTLTKIKAVTQPKQVSRKNGKFKIQLSSTVAIRKRARKSTSPKKNQICEEALDILRQDLNHSEDDSGDEPLVKCDLEKVDKSASDVEAQNLIEGLKERGIHLVHNKSPKTRYITPDRNSQSGQQNIQIPSISGENTNGKSLNDGQPNTQTPSKNNFSVEFAYNRKDVHDTWTFEGEDAHFIFDEQCVPRKIESYDMASLKPCIAKLFLEEINREIEIPIQTTQFYCLFDSEIIHEKKQFIEATKENLSKADQTDQETGSSNRKELNDEINKNEDVIKPETEEKSTKEITVNYSESASVSEEYKLDDDLMTFALTGKSKEESLQNVKKKLKVEEFPKDKKCESLLKSINVDSFLNNIHGRHNT